MKIKGDTIAVAITESHERRLREVEGAILFLAAGWMICGGMKKVIGGTKLIAKTLKHLNEPLEELSDIPGKNNGLYTILRDAL